MADGNIGQQAASAVDAKIQEFQALQEGIGQSKQKLGTLMAQRNEVRVVLAYERRAMLPGNWLLHQCI